MQQSVRITTHDGVSVAGTYVATDHPRAWAVLAHMMPATKESFGPFALALADAAIASLAIDLRGHGESDGGPTGYQHFTDQQHQRSLLDIDAAVEYLRSRGADEEHIFLVGASIGANVSLQCLASRAALPGAVLLSPGVDYRGILAKEYIVALRRGQGIFIASSQDDGYNAQEVEELWGLVPDGVIKEKEIYARAGHGTTMLEKEPSLTKKIIQFIHNLC
jgi:alpha-beta hydrolase superfamily lysophospholipase